MKVVFTPEVEEDLYEIVKMLIKRNIWVLYLIKAEFNLQMQQNSD